MHELVLFAPVPPSQHHFTLSVLAGLTSMQPQPVFERHLLFRPMRTPNTPAPKEVLKRGTELGLSANMINGTFIVNVFGDVSSKAEVSEDWNSEAERPSDFERYIWSCDFKDLPEVPGKRPATSRVVERVKVPAGKKAWMLTFMEGVGYKYNTEYVFVGDRFTHGNIDIRVHRIHRLPESSAPADVAPKTADGLNLLDDTGAYVMQASIMVADDKVLELMNSAFSELANLKELLKSLVDLDLGDRLAMNTRVR